ncbi:MAG: flippase [Actinomycetota bacterium]|nr:flippase [Actinomycetota bacterium]
MARNTALLVGGRLAVTASGLVGTIVATRYLGVEEFGQLLTAVTFVALFGVLTDAGVWTIAAREIAKRPEDEQSILATVSLIGLVLSAGTFALVVSAMFIVYGGADRELVRLGIVVIGTQLLVSGPLGTSSAFMTAHQFAVPGALGGLLAGVGFLVALALAVSADLGFAGIAGAYTVSAVLNAVVPIVAVSHSVSLRPRLDRPLAVELLRAALPQGFVLAITVVYIRLDTVLLSVLATDRDVGFYGLSYRVLEFLLLVPLFATNTVFPELARAGAHSERLRMLVQGMVSALIIVSVPLVCVCAGFAPEIVRVAGGVKYDEAAGVLRLLVLAVVCSFPATVLVGALVATDQQRALARALLVVLAGNVLLNLVLIDAMQARGAALALILSELGVLAFSWRLFARVSRPPRLQLPARLAVAATVCAVTVVAVRLVVAEPADDPLLVLALGGSAATGMFVFTAVVLRALPVEVTSAVAQLRGNAEAEPS